MPSIRLAAPCGFRTRVRSLAWVRYWKFILASLVGLAVNSVVLVALIAAFTFPLLVIPQAVGILGGMAANFVASRTLVFRRS